jgi:MFS family permease
MDKLKKALNYSIIDGGLSSIAGAMFSGVFITGFALNVLKADLTEIGILAALPILANVIQVVSAYIVQKTGEKKIICIVTMAVDRSLMLVIALLPLQIFGANNDLRVWGLVFILGISSLFKAFSGLAWVSWISDLVPFNERGRFFGKRSMICSICSVGTILPAGYFLTLWERWYGPGNPYGFFIVFSVGALAGMLGLIFSYKIPKGAAIGNNEKSDVGLADFVEPFKNHNFRMALSSAICGRFALLLSVPFYTVFAIKNLDMDFSLITVYSTVATITTILVIRRWGFLIDRFGPMPVASVVLRILSVVPLAWFFVNKQNYLWLIPIIAIFNGCALSATELLRMSVFLEIAEEKKRSIYLALFNSIPDLIASTAPIIGACIATALSGFEYTIFGYTIVNLHILFLITGILRFFTFSVLFPRIHGLGDAKPGAIIVAFGKMIDISSDGTKSIQVIGSSHQRK